MTDTTAAFPPVKTEEELAKEAAAKAAAEAEAHDAEIRTDAIEDAAYLAESVFEEALHSFGKGSVESLVDVIDSMRVSLGLLHPRGPHHSAPGMDSILKEVI